MNMRITSIQEEIQKNGNQWQSMAIKQNRIVGFLASLGSKSLLISFLNPNPMESNESKKKKKLLSTNIIWILHLQTEKRKNYT